MHSINWIDYNAAMQSVGLSQHVNQLAKRQKKYPHLFKNAGSRTLIHVSLANAISLHHYALSCLSKLKETGGQHE
jgi:hypothetical protein